MEKKYVLTDEIRTHHCPKYGGVVLHRIRALKDFCDVKKGDLGGWVESEDNLSQYGNCWIYDDAAVYGKAYVLGDATVSGRASVCGCARVREDARVCDRAYIHDDACIFNHAKIHGDAVVFGKAHIGSDADIESVDDYFEIGPIGSRHDYTTFYRKTEEIYVHCGCFNGPLEDFEKKVEEVHRGTMYETEYFFAIEIAKKKIKKAIPKKYELTNEVEDFGGTTIHRIRALRDFGDVKKGDLGGFVESEDNLSHEGDCWIYDDAVVKGQARVYENAKIQGTAGVHDHAEVYGNARVFEKALITGDSEVFGNASIKDHAVLRNSCKVGGAALISDNAMLSDSSCVCEFAMVQGTARLYESARVSGTSFVTGYAVLHGTAEIRSSGDYFIAGPFNDPYDYVTVYRSRENGLLITYGMYSGAVEYFTDNIKKYCSANALFAIKEIVAMCLKRFLETGKLYAK